MMNRVHVVTPLAAWFWLVFACGAASGQGQLLLKSGFEAEVRVTDDMSDIVGVDRGCGYDWEATPEWIESSRFVYLVGRDKTLREYMASSIEKMIGPFGNETRVLRLENRADDPDHKSTSRNEYSFFVKPPPDDYGEGYVRYWMKLQPDLGELVPQDRPTPWYMIMEWKEPNSGTAKSARECRQVGQGPGGSNNYRINVHIRREANAEEFRWYLTGEHPQPCRKTEWTYLNPEVPVPLGRWFLVEAYMKKHPTAGRVYFAVDGQVVLDTRITRPEGFTGRTEHADNPLPLRFWSPMKNYHSMAWNRSGPISQWYDDIELRTTFPPGHPALREDDTQQKVVFREHFNYPNGTLPPSWWSEGDPGEIRGGRLYVNADTGPFRRSTIWLDRVFGGDLRVEYDVCVLASADHVNNMNFFLLYSEPSGRALRESSSGRMDGNYPRYHQLSGYIFTNVADGDDAPARFRFRDCPGFHLLAEARRYENRQRTVYHVSIEKRRGRFTYRVDGNTVLDTTDDRFNPPHDRGLLGFRTWHTELWWDNLVVTRL